MTNANDQQVKPQLTLTPSLDDAPVPELVAQPAATVPSAPEQATSQLDDSMLTDEEKQMVDSFAQQIDVRDSAMVLQYGAGAQKKMADFSETALSGVRTKDLGEVGGLITDVVTELRSFDATEEKGLFGFFKKGASKVDALRTRYDKAEANVNKIVEALKGHQMTLMKDAATLDKMYELNLTYFKELTMYLLAGKKKLAEVRSGDLAKLTEQARISGRAEDAQAAQDLEAMCTRFEKKLGDLDLTRTIAMQTAPQIRLVQNNEIVLVEKIQTTIVNTIPLWKSQMVLALGIANSAEAARAQNAVTNMTNDLLKKNAEMLHTSTVDIARESERGIVDIETLKNTNETLIKTFDEVMQIQAEGRQKRAEAEAEMRRMEADLKQKMLEIPRV
ncbi:toxic anion resistance protein [Senegalimassilia faecalis]|uniref:Toxic anion resistance protein n=1 Tax=Senegalimassilia faecalis TaxID=2509433 RepID=A0A4Q2K3Z9_9ACTN|nr:toxic anion resistance protein [Senegalimassilia faecalis]RXZ54334.1 toxic anion resistance protein [Senegalimassilia faecalis]RXZ55012.1 toxic anion resistance protein [Senegalimassilia faecalis]